MQRLKFEWDEVKNLSNQKKHKVSFDEAKSVFYDESAIQFYDPDHSEDEDRFLLLGIGNTSKVLVVCHCFRKNDLLIRIISARKADKKEQNNYWSRR